MKGVIAAGDIQTASAGEEILKQGGNAYDAAIACMLAAPLCEPLFTSLGGGGFMITKNSTCKPIVYDFFVNVPPNNDRFKDFYGVDVDFGSAIQEFHIGLASSAVPGMIKGIWAIYKDFASMDMSELIKPALKYARDGIYLSPYQAEFMKLLEKMFLANEHSRSIYGKDGELIDSKHLFKNYEYSEFLESFAKGGEEIFYEGEVAKDIVKLCEEKGGLITKECLRDYSLKKREPIKLNFRGYETYLNPPPSSGGILIAFSLLLLKDYPNLTYGSDEFVKTFLEVQNSTNLFRKEKIDEFLFDEDLKSILKNEEIINAFKYQMQKRLNPLGNTTQLSIVDEENNALSITTTNGEGCGHVVHKTGILLNNMLGEEDLNPHGFFTWDDGIRLPSMMCPTLLTKDEKLQLVLGAAGSNRIRSAILNTILGYINSKNIQEAILLPRGHLDKGVFYAEKGFMDKVSDYGYELKYFEEKNLFFGGVQGATCKLQGGADIRRYGAVVEVS